MPIVFPCSPAVNDTYTFGSYTWRWDGTTWVSQMSPNGATGATGPTGIGVTGPTGATGPVTVTQNIPGTSYTLVAGDNGKHIYTSFGVTVPSGVFSAGQVVSIANSGTADITITQGSSVTMYLAGSATTGNRTLAQKGLATVLCVASNTFIILGGGLT